MALIIYDKNGVGGLPVPVIAYDIATMQKVGEYDNCAIAARKLFIRSSGSIHAYLNGTNGVTFKGKKKGVSSYKTGIKYHFELKK